MADNDVTRIAGNIGAMNALNALSIINKQLSVHTSRLATGKRINSAADDPAGLTIATKMMARSEGLKVSLNNIGDAKNLLAVAESGLGRINDILIQMRNKAEQGASDTMGQAERQVLIDQMSAYSKQIDDVVAQTKWASGTGAKSLIGGEYDATALTFQTGVDSGETTTLDGLQNMTASAADGLNLAAVSTSAASIGTVTGTVSTAAAAAKSNPNLVDLSSGTYKVSVSYAAISSITLTRLDSTDALQVDADGADGTNPIDVVVQKNISASGVVDFGNGLTVTVGVGTVGTAAATGTVVFVGPAEEYSLKYNNGASTLKSSDSASTFATYMTDIQGKLDVVSSQLSKIGSLNGSLTFKEDQISVAQINTEGAYNRIMNANMAEEQVNASKLMILQQTATAMLAQANAAPQFLLSLFR
jgi:flagellin